MTFQQTDTEDSASPLSEVSSLDDHFDAMQLEIESSDEEAIDDDMDSKDWNEIEAESDEEFLDNHGLIKEMTAISEDNTTNPIDCYRHFITDELSTSWFVKLIDTRSSTYKTMRPVDGQYVINENQPLMKRCSTSFESLSKWDWYKC